MRDQEDKTLGHWIIPGDWVIREAPDKVVDDDFEAVRNPTGYILSDRAVLVLDVTKSHMTIYDPVKGVRRIIQLSMFPGTWRRATKTQVDTSWDLAVEIRPLDVKNIELERKNYTGRG